jgi:hypothetical protein
MNTPRATICFFLFMVPHGIFGQDRPLWVETGTIPWTEKCYFGIGISKSSFDESDARARVQFALDVSTRVSAVFKHEVREDGMELTSRTEVQSDVVAEEVLRGVRITARYADTLYYSLIRYGRAEYDSLLADETRHEVEQTRLKTLLAEEKRVEDLRARHVEDSLKTVEDAMQIAAQKEELERREAQIALERQEKGVQAAEFGEFVALDPPEKVVTLRNAELVHGSSAISLAAAISPLAFQRGYWALRVWQIELSAQAAFREGRVQQQEAFAKVQVLPHVGGFLQTTLSIGLVQAMGTIRESGFSLERSKYSLFVAGNLTVPRFAHSYISVYLDKRMFAFGINAYPLYSLFQNHIGFICDVHTILDQEFGDRFGDPVYVQCGIRLHADESLSTVIAYEGNESLVLTFEFEF